MKTITILIFLFMTLSIKAQEHRDFLVNKTFTAHVASVCEETIEPDPCAGQQVYLVLRFESKKVAIAEKSVTTCGEVAFNELGSYTWKLLNNKEISIDTDAEKIAYTFMQDLKLELKDGHLIGKKKDWNDAIIEYIFEDTVANE